VIRSIVPGDDVPELGRIASIIPRGEGWALLGANGETLLTISDRAGAARTFDRKRIFE
jgi:hypothetical protein